MSIQEATVAKARKTDPRTSHDAAESVNNITEVKAHILKLLKVPRTHNDLVAIWMTPSGKPRSGFCKASPEGIRSRCADLVREGRVVDTGERIKLASGRHAIIWKSVK